VDPAHGISKRFQLRQEGKSYLLGKINLRGGPIVVWLVARCRNLGELGDSGAWGGCCCWLGEVSRQTCDEWRQRKSQICGSRTAAKSGGVRCRNSRCRNDGVKAVSSSRPAQPWLQPQRNPSERMSRPAPLLWGMKNQRRRSPRFRLPWTGVCGPASSRDKIVLPKRQRMRRGFSLEPNRRSRMSCRDVGILRRERRYWATPSVICAQSIFSVPLSLNTRP